MIDIAVLIHVYWPILLTERFSIPYQNQIKEDTIV